LRVSGHMSNGIHDAGAPETGSEGCPSGIEGGGAEVRNLDLPAWLTDEKFEAAIAVVSDWEEDRRSAAELIERLLPILEKP
jgi:hypothetical protein